MIENNIFGNGSHYNDIKKQNKKKAITYETTKTKQFYQVLSTIE